jgi:hypothetical protein
VFSFLEKLGRTRQMGVERRQQTCEDEMLGFTATSIDESIGRHRCMGVP